MPFRGSHAAEESGSKVQNPYQSPQPHTGKQRLALCAVLSNQALHIPEIQSIRAQGDMLPSNPVTQNHRFVTMSPGLRRIWRWIFLIAGVQFAMLCADFLSNFGLLADIKHRRLFDPTTCLTVTGQLTTIDSLRPSVTLAESHPEYASVPANFLE
ncbi:uncharacterized protein DEA37_0005158 [Paragonimus westermani]|uniref:Uncharacterized protein n=1 Tax=Paragonimus westermani TaxID=34504 RepID=A0A5J4NGM6_9TREM|nr:uncharacterized protein DEA37_0005158 [Paragonimus westermani]